MTGIETGAIGAVALLIPVVAALIVNLCLVPVRLWIAAVASGAYVSLFTLVGMRLRRVPPGTIVTARISAVKAGLDIPVNDLEAHLLPGGNVVNVVHAMISADKASRPHPRSSRQPWWGSSRGTTDVGVHRPANNHHVHVGRPGNTLQVDLGACPNRGIEQAAGELEHLGQSASPGRPGGAGFTAAMGGCAITASRALASASVRRGCGDDRSRKGQAGEAR